MLKRQGSAAGSRAAPASSVAGRTGPARAGSSSTSRATGEAPPRRVSTTTTASAGSPSRPPLAGRSKRADVATVSALALSDLLPLAPRRTSGGQETGRGTARPPPSSSTGCRMEAEEEVTLSRHLQHLHLQQDAERDELRSALEQLQAEHQQTLAELEALRSLHLETLAGAGASSSASGASGRRELLLLQSTNIQLKRALLAQRGQAQQAAAQYQDLLEAVLDVRKVVEAVTHNLVQQQQPPPPPPPSKAKSSTASSTNAAAAAGTRPGDGNVAALQSVCTVLARATRRARPRPSTMTTVSSAASSAPGGSGEDGANPAMLMLADFLAQPQGTARPPVRLADLCSGTVAHLHVGQVGRLEAQLWSLSARLHALQASLDTAFLPHTRPEFRVHSATLLQGCQTSLQEACAALLSLSVLLPAAPVPELSHVQRLGPVDVGPDPGEEAQLLLARLPSLSASTRSKLEAMVAGLVKLLLATRAQREEEVARLRDELAFHRDAYATYHASIASILDGLEARRAQEAQLLQDFLAGLERVGLVEGRSATDKEPADPSSLASSPSSGLAVQARRLVELLDGALAPT